MEQTQTALRRAVRPVVFLVVMQVLFAVIGALGRGSEQCDSRRLALELLWRLPLAIVAGAVFGILRPRFSFGRGGAALCGLVAGAATGMLWAALGALSGVSIFDAFVFRVPACMVVGVALSQFERPRLQIKNGIRAS